MKLTAEEIVARIYWLKGQIPPKDWRKDWPKIEAQLKGNKIRRLKCHQP